MSQLIRKTDPIGRPTKAVLPFLCAALLSSCLPFSGEKAAYTLHLDTQDEQLQTYLQKIISDREGEEFEESDDPALDQRRENYREQMVKADLEKGLRAKGYYEGDVTYKDRPDKALAAEYTVSPGPRYTLGSIRVEPAKYSPYFKSEDVQKGKPLDALNVLQAQADLQEALGKDKCYFSLDVEHGVILSKSANQGELTYHVEIGPEAHFGSVTFTGQDEVKESYLRKLIPWKEGDCYQAAKIEKLRAKLLESGLFSRADIKLPEMPDKDGSVPITIDLGTRAMRSVSAGLSYYTDEGPGMTAGWEHRNFFGSAEKLSANLTISSIKQRLGLTLDKPFFMRKDQNLFLNTAIQREDSDAYEELSYEVGGKLKRSFGKHWSASTGANFSVSNIKEKNDQNQESQTYGLLSFPQTLTYDNRNDTLNPTKGWLLSATATPFVDAFGQSDPFFKTELGAATYLRLDEQANHILAFRSKYGSIFGSGQFDIPPTERFYAGGGGSVRGYGYQEVGPKDSDGDPLGGRSIFTGTTEYRWKFTPTIGAVAFVDAGTVSDTTTPDFSNLAVGAGIGARYYTGFGPLRFDIATPLTQKEDLEQNYQFYISIGQAF
ncbi:MAG: autotransporter assembly complex family protein [Pseudobdellovibrionaceae bacterium]